MSAADRMVIRTGDGEYRSVPRRAALGMLAAGRAHAEHAQQAPAVEVEAPVVPATPDSPPTPPQRAQTIQFQPDGPKVRADGTNEPTQTTAPIVEQIAAELGADVSHVPPAAPRELPQEPRGNASRAAWAEYAQSLGVEVTSSMTRDQIRDAAQDAAQSLANLPQPALPGGRLETPEDEPVTEESVTDDEDPGTR